MIRCIFLFLLISPISVTGDLKIIQNKRQTYCIANEENAFKAIFLKRSSGSSLDLYNNKKLQQFSQRKSLNLTVGNQVNSLTYNMEFLDDFRWNSLRTYRSNNKLPLRNEPEIVRFDQSAWNISFSIMGEKNAYIILAEKSPSSRYYYICFDAMRNTVVTEIRKCHKIYRYASECEENLYTFENTSLLDSNEWRHFTLSWDNGHLGLWSNPQKEKIFEIEDKSVFSIDSLHIREFNNEILWRFHLYEFYRIEQTTETRFSVKASKILFFFYYIEGDATINIFQNDIKIVQLESKEGSLNKWQTFNYQINLNSSLVENEIIFKFNKEDIKAKIFIDEISFLEDIPLFSFIQIFKDNNNLNCYILGEEQRVNTTLPFAVKIPDCISEACESENSILSGTNYEDYLYCSSINKDCRCFPGYILEGNYCGACPYGKYGLGCQNTCGECVNKWGQSQTCHSTTGKCDSCQKGYATEFCNETLPVATEPPELINVGTTWVVLKIHIKSYKGVDPYFWQPVVINQNQSKSENNFFPENYDNSSNVIEKRLDNLNFLTNYDIWVKYLMENNDNMYKYNKTISDQIILKIKTSCDANNNFDLTYTNESLTVTQKWFRHGNECFLYNYNYVLTSEKKELINQTKPEFDIEPYTKYNLAIYLKTELVFSENFTSLDGVPSQVINITTSLITNDGFKISWEPPQKKNAKIEKYLIKHQLIASIACRPICSSFKRNNNEIETQEIEETFKHFSQLEPYSLYLVEISAKTKNFPGEPNRVCVKTNKTSNPQFVPDIQILDLDAKFIKIGCKLPKNCAEITAPIDGCTIMIKGKNFVRSESTSEAFEDIEIQNLIPYTNYTLYGSIKSENKSLNFVKVESFLTKPSAPGPVQDVLVYNVSTTMRYIRLRLPYPPNGILQEITIETYWNKYSTYNLRKYTFDSHELKECPIWPEMYCLEIENENRDYLKIYVVNEINQKGNSSSWINVTLPSKVSSEPLNITVSPEKENFIINWEYPAQSNGYFEKFICEISNVDSYLIDKSMISNFSRPREVGNIQPTYNLTIDLEQSTNYIITVYASKKEEKGNKQMINFETPPKAAPVPKWEIIEDETINFTISFDKKQINYKKLTNQSRIYIILQKMSNDEKQYKFLEESFKEEGFEKDLFDAANITSKDQAWIAREILCNNISINKTFGVSHTSLSNDGMAKFQDRPLDLNSKYKVHLVLANGKPGLWKFSSESDDINTKIIIKSYIWLWLLITFLIISILVVLLYVFRRHIRFTINVENRYFTIPLRNNSNDNNLPLVNTRSQLKPKTASPSEIPLEENKTEIEKESILSKIVLVRELENYIEELFLEEDSVKLQYCLVPSGQTKPWTQGKLPQNRPKNRYGNMLPYDYNRVVLTQLPNEPYSDYINASYMNGYKSKHFYIATQGPKTNTINDFWRMVVENKSQIIVMVTNLIESGKIKCEQYWPEIDHSQNYGNINVKTIRSQVFSDFAIRKFEITHYKSKWKIQHLHFTSWPDHGVPLYFKSVASFTKKLLATPKGSGPIIIHCSAGVGRTGTIMLIDLTLRMAAEEGFIDILGIFQKLRQQRINMVDRPNQYKLVHQVVLECLAHDNSAIPCDGKFFQNILQLRKEGKLNKQWARIQPSSLIPLNEDSAHLNKNRDSSIVPGTKGQVFIQCWPFDDPSSNYINAVYVDGFRMKDQYIVTQHPLPATYGDFWRLVIEKEIGVILALNDFKNFDDPTVFPLEPIEKVNEHLLPDFIKIKKKHQCEEQWTITTLLLSNDAAFLKDSSKCHEVELIQFHDWHPNKPLPEKVGAELLIQLCRRLERFQKKPILITCLDGAQASGLFVGLAFLIEMIKTDQECDVMQTISIIRESRPQFIVCKDQFEFLYDAAICYVKLFETYANFT